MCAAALYWSQISKIVFGGSDQQKGFENIGNNFNQKNQVFKGVLASECLDLMLRFSAERRK